MPFHIRPLKEFLVRPALPPPLDRMSELAYDLYWSWDHSVRSLFRRLDPALWKACDHNPVLMLGRVSQATLEAAAKDPRYLALYRRACERLDAYLHSAPASSDLLVAYFSMEYGLLDCMPIYSGGLGVLSGDYLKSASDAGLRLVGVGLLYQKGYLQQVLNPDGWQQERNPVNDFYSLPVLPVTQPDGTDLLVHVTFPTGGVALKVWRIKVGRVTLYLLDTNIPENQPGHRDITDHLYGGDIHTRIRQEIVLGIGGLRALKALGLEPTVYHMNEGHSAFLAIERIRLLMREHNLNFEEALDAARSNNVFTTHTSVPAGIDLFDAGLMYEYFGDYCRDANISFEQLLALGRRNPEDPHERFSMAITAIKASSFRNAVSRLHRRVSQEMWQDLWPGLPQWEVPITCITNGVHLPTWLSSDMAELYDQYLQPDWREHPADPKVWENIQDIPNHELWDAHRRSKRRFLAFVREHAVAAASQRKASASELRRLQDVLDPEALTIGFARRFATYKRATLIFRDVERLKRILLNPRRPVQIVIAGKAHPKDHPGKSLIREIVQLSRNPELVNHIVFLEDYGIQVAREMVQGVDLWLNTPRRGEEACGTSGMKAGLNGVLNFSILDGWFDEAAESTGGWAIGDREPYSEDQDEVHATTIYSTIENEIVPAYYDDREEEVPEEWVRRMKQSAQFISANFNCQRMVRDYVTQLYESAHRIFADKGRDGFRAVRERADWNRTVQSRWGDINFVEISPGPDRTVVSGTAIPLRAVVQLAGLQPKDVRVEAVIGRVGINGDLEDTQVIYLPPQEPRDSGFAYGTELVLNVTGKLGYAIRVSPNHCDDPLNRPCNALLKWGAGKAD